MRVTALLAHPDDEIFCAGTLARLNAEGHHVTLWTLFVDNARRDAWMRSCTALNVQGLACSVGEDDFTCNRHYVRTLEPMLPPTDLLITHRAEDPNTSHRAIGQIARTFARKNTMSVWEIDAGFAFDADARGNNHYVDITAHSDTKFKVADCYIGVLTASDLDAIAARDEWNGHLIHTDRAEAFRIHKSVLL